MSVVGFLLYCLIFLSDVWNKFLQLIQIHRVMLKPGPSYNIVFKNESNIFCLL